MRMTFGLLALTIVLTVPTAALAQSESRNAAFARVEKSGTLRCGYAVYPPFLIKDPATGKLSGISYELTEALGILTRWKIEWAVQTTYPTPSNTKAIEDLASGKFDMLCAGVPWYSPWEQKGMWATPQPLFFTGFGVYVREKDTRFANGFDVRKLNDPQYKMVVNEGVGVDRLRRVDFPKVGTVLSGYNDMIKELGNGKGDFAIIELEVANDYIAANPGKIRNIAADHPLRAYGVSFQVAYGEERLRNVVDAAATELLWGGTVDTILDKYEKVPTFYRVAMPYRPFGARR
jgi:ABC-type amino acid transport substrate-binding protein